MSDPLTEPQVAGHPGAQDPSAPSRPVTGQHVTPLRFAVLGDPIGHSKSPAMHAAAYRVARMPHSYEALRVTAEDLPRLVEQLRKGVYAGFNITVPHKRRVLDLVDEVAPTARTAGAANTLVRTSDGRIVAHNTDAPALALEIQALAPEAHSPWAHGRALVIGTGGAARSAIAALAIDLKVPRIAIRARGDASKVEALVAEMTPLLASVGGTSTLLGEPLVAVPELEAETCMVVQATSAGMIGAEPGDGVASAVAWDALPPRAVAYDVVYAPPETPFLRAAREHGIRGANGIGMLARQGALAFELWLGGTAPYNAMLTALI